MRRQFETTNGKCSRELELWLEHATKERFMTSDTGGGFVHSVGTPQGVATRLPTCRCLDLKARNRTLGAHFGHQELSPCEVFAQSNFTGHALRRAPDCVAES